MASTRAPLLSSKKRTFDAGARRDDVIVFPRGTRVDEFMEMVDSIDVVEVFHTGTDLKDQFARLYGLPFLKDYHPKIKPTGKDADLARKCLLDGKVLQESKALEESLQKFNEAVRNAEPWSRELGSAYYERSTTLFQMGEFELSRKDGVRALKFCLSEDAKKAVLRRQIACRDAIEEAGFERDVTRISTRLEGMRKSLGEPWVQKEVASQVVRALQSAPRAVTPALKRKNQNDPRLPRMHGNRNTQIPATADALKLGYTQEQGRYYMASRRILPGEVLTVENPLATALYTDCWTSHCYHCHRKTMAGVPCFTCALIIFCGEHCRDTAMKYHGIECSHMVELFDLGDGDGVLLAYRMIVQHPVEELLMWRPIVEAGVFDTPRSAESTETLLVCNELGSTFDLLTHHADTSPFYTLKAAKTAVFLTKCLEQTPYFGDHDDDDVKVYVGQLLYHYLLVVVCNYFTASEVSLTPGPPYRAVTPPIAMNLYCAGSYFNHSCAPNVTHYFVNGRLIARAHQIIEPGEAVCISYGSSAHSELLPDRRSYLWNGFHFICKCPACVGYWAPLRQLLLSCRGELKLKVFESSSSGDVDTETASTSDDTSTGDEEDDDDDDEVEGTSEESLENKGLGHINCLEKSIQDAVAEIQEEIARAEEQLKKNSPVEVSLKATLPENGAADGQLVRAEPPADFGANTNENDSTGVLGELNTSITEDLVLDCLKKAEGTAELLISEANGGATPGQAAEYPKESPQHVKVDNVSLDSTTTRQDILESLTALDKKRAALKALLAEKRRRQVLGPEVKANQIALEANKRTVGGSEVNANSDSVKTEYFDPQSIAIGANPALKNRRSSHSCSSEGLDSEEASEEVDPTAVQRYQWTKEAVSILPMWPKAGDESPSSNSEPEKAKYVLSGGYRCPKCNEKLDGMGVTSVLYLRDKKCPSCSVEFKAYVDKCLRAKDTSEELRMMVEGGHFARIHDAIEATGVYIQAVQSFALFPNLELLSTIVHLAHFFLMETVV